VDIAGRRVLRADDIDQSPAAGGSAAT